MRLEHTQHPSPHIVDSGPAGQPVTGTSPPTRPSITHSVIAAAGASPGAVEAGAERVFPVAAAGEDGAPRVTWGVVIEGAEVLGRRGYPAPAQLAEEDWVALRQVLFGFRYGGTPAPCPRHGVYLSHSQDNS